MGSMKLAWPGPLLIVLMGIAACDDSPSAGAAERPARLLGCDARVEGPPGLPVLNRKTDLATRPVIFYGLKDEAARARRHPESVERRYRDGIGVVKILIAVRAGVRATVSIASRGRRKAGLMYGTSSDPRNPRARLRQSDKAVEFEGCPADEPRFSPDGGKVGRHTQFAGGFIVSESHCLRLRVSARGGSSRVYELAYGVPRRRC